MAARTGRPYKLQVLSTNGERKLQGSANKPTGKDAAEKNPEEDLGKSMKQHQTCRISGHMAETAVESQLKHDIWEIE